MCIDRRKVKDDVNVVQGVIRNIVEVDMPFLRNLIGLCIRRRIVLVCCGSQRGRRTGGYTGRGSPSKVLEGSGKSLAGLKK